MKLNAKMMLELHYCQTVKAYRNGVGQSECLAFQAAPAESAEAATAFVQRCIPKRCAYAVVNTTKEDFPDSPEEQKKLMHKALLRYHPDKGGDGDLFHLAKFTFEMLMDPVRKRWYDKHGWVGGFRQVHVEYSLVERAIGVGVCARLIREVWVTAE